MKLKGNLTPVTPERLCAAVTIFWLIAILLSVVWLAVPASRYEPQLLLWFHIPEVCWKFLPAGILPLLVGVTFWLQRKGWMRLATPEEYAEPFPFAHTLSNKDFWKEKERRSQHQQHSGMFN